MVGRGPRKLGSTFHASPFLLLLLLTQTVSVDGAICDSSIKRVHAEPIKLTLRTPGYPDRFPSFCTSDWRIDTVSDVVELTLKDIDLAGAGNCDTDYVKIYDGSDYSGKVLVKLCSLPTDSASRTIMSSSSSIYIRVVSSNRRQGKGLDLLYQGRDIFCKAEVVELTSTFLTKTLKSPGYPKLYESANVCSWKITARDDDDIVKLTLKEMNIDTRDSCFRNWLKIYDGADSTAREIDTYCRETEIPYNIEVTSSSRSIFLQYKVTDATKGQGFQIEYRSTIRPYDPVEDGFDDVIPTTIGITVGVTVFMVLLFGCIWFIRRQRMNAANQVFQRQMVAYTTPYGQPQPQSFYAPPGTVMTSSFPSAPPPPSQTANPAYATNYGVHQDGQNNNPPPPYSSVVENG